MKHIFWTFIIGIIVGVAIQYFWINPRYVTDNKPIHDTINITNDSIQVNDSLVTVEKIPNMFIKSLDSISIDTINTVVNGKVTESKIKVTIK